MLLCLKKNQTKKQQKNKTKKKKKKHSPQILLEQVHLKN